MYSRTIISSGKTSRGIAIRNLDYVYVENGGKAVNTSIYYGVQDVSGIASNTLISASSPYSYSSSYAVQNIFCGGSAIDTRILGSGAIMVVDGGVARITTIDSGGCQEVYFGQAYNTTVNNGFLYVTFGGVAINANVANNSKAAIQLSTGGRLEYSSNVTMSGTLEIFGERNTINRLNTNTNSNIKFFIPGFSNNRDYLLTVDKSSKNNGVYSIVVSKIQQAGNYKLASNLNNSSSIKYTVYMLSSAHSQTKVGSATVNKSLTENGMTYTLNSKNNALTLKVALKAGRMLKGTTRNDTLTGNKHSDIFYGGKGNDTITGVNGRDVAIYDSTSWGKDVIKKTSGTMTIMFNGIDRHNILFKRSNKNMIISKRNDQNQKIAINNWDDHTHNVVYTDSIKSFKTYLNQTSPTTSTVNTVRKDVWQKSCLASK